MLTLFSLFNSAMIPLLLLLCSEHPSKLLLLLLPLHVIIIVVLVVVVVYLQTHWLRLTCSHIWQRNFPLVKTIHTNCKLKIDLSKKTVMIVCLWKIFWTQLRKKRVRRSNQIFIHFYPFMCYKIVVYFQYKVQPCKQMILSFLLWCCTTFITSSIEKLPNMVVWIQPIFAMKKLSPKRLPTSKVVMIDPKIMILQL